MRWVHVCVIQCPHDCLCLFALLQVNNCARMQYKFYMNDPHWRGGDGNPGSPGIMLSRATNSLPGVHDDRMPSASSPHRRITTASPSHQPSSHRSLTCPRIVHHRIITASSPHHSAFVSDLCKYDAHGTSGSQQWPLEDYQSIKYDNKIKEDVPKALKKHSHLPEVASGEPQKEWDELFENWPQVQALCHCVRAPCPQSSWCPLLSA